MKSGEPLLNLSGELYVGEYQNKLTGEHPGVLKWFVVLHKLQLRPLKGKDGKKVALCSLLNKGPL